MRPVTMNISVPAAMKAFVAERMAVEGFANASEYVRHLIRREQARINHRLEALLLEGLNSGEPVELTPAVWEEIGRRVKQRAAEVRRVRRKAAG